MFAANDVNFHRFNCKSKYVARTLFSGGGTISKKYLSCSYLSYYLKQKLNLQ